MVLVRLLFPLNTHQNANQKPIGSAPAYWAQCTLPPDPIYQTLLFDFSRVWSWDYFIPILVHTSTNEPDTIYFYRFCTHGTVVCITIVMQFSHCYCFASERKVTLAMLRPSCLVCQPFIIGSSVSQERILETLVQPLIVNTLALVAQNQCTAAKTMIIYMTAWWGWITFSEIAKETWYRIVLNFRGSKFSPIVSFSK